MKKIITVFNKQYKVVKSNHFCEGCAANVDEDICGHFNAQNGTCAGVIYQELQDGSSTPKITQNNPSINLSFDLDLSTVGLPEVFKLKGLRLSTLDEVLSKRTDAFTVNVRELPQETIEVIAQALAVEFLRRYSK
jgi:hypothetical protein